MFLILIIYFFKYLNISLLTNLNHEFIKIFIKFEKNFNVLFFYRKNIFLLIKQFLSKNNLQILNFLIIMKKKVLKKETNSKP